MGELSQNEARLFIEMQAAELTALRARVAELEGALIWAETIDPQLVDEIRERAAKGNPDGTS